MATFITTIKFTQQGIKGIADSTKRAAALKAAAKKMGAKVTNVFWTLGEYDGLLILEAPDDETAILVVGLDDEVFDQVRAGRECRVRDE